MARPVSIKVSLDARDAKRGLDELNTHSKTTFTEMASAVSLVKDAFGAIAGAIGPAIDFFKESVAASADAEKSEQKLIGALRARGQASSDVISSLKQQASSVQELTAVEGDSVTELQASLSLRGVHSSRLREATQASVGLATVTGDLSSAGNLVARVLNGNVKALEKYGIHARSSTEAMSKLSLLFGVAQQEATTYEGRLTQLANAYGDLQEEVGSVITGNQAVKELFVQLTGIVVDLTGHVSSGKGNFSDMLTKGILTLTSAMGGLLEFLSRLYDSFTGIMRPITAVYEALKSSFEMYMKITGVSDVIDVISKEISAAEQARKQLGLDAEREGNIFDDWARSSRELAFNLAQAAAEAERLTRPDGTQLSAGEAGDRFAEVNDSVNASAWPGVQAQLTGRNKKKPKRQQQAKPMSDDDLSTAARSILNTDSETEEWLEEQRRLIEDHTNRMNELDTMRLDQLTSDLEMEKQLHELGIQNTADLNSTELRQALVHAQSLKEIDQQQLQAKQSFFGQFQSIAVGGFTNIFSQIGSSLASGSKTVGDMMKGFAGALLSTVGQMLIALGTAGLAAALGSTALPFLIPIFGGPAGVAAAGGIIAAGAVLSGIGSGLASSASSASKTVKAAPSVESVASPSAEVRSQQSRDEKPVNITVNINGQTFVGDRIELGRHITEIIQEAQRNDGVYA